MSEISCKLTIARVAEVLDGTAVVNTVPFPDGHRGAWLAAVRVAVPWPRTVALTGSVVGIELADGRAGDAVCFGAMFQAAAMGEDGPRGTLLHLVGVSPLEVPAASSAAAGGAGASGAAAGGAGAGDGDDGQGHDGQGRRGQG